jgi:preprotein translocase subunit SecE
MSGLVLTRWAASSYVECSVGTASEIMAKLNPFKFMQEVRQETNKVTWPSRRETAITTAMVFVFAAAAAIFFLLADQVIRVVVTLVLGVAG